MTYNLITLILVDDVRHLVHFDARLLSHQFRLPADVDHKHTLGARVQYERHRAGYIFGRSKQQRNRLAGEATVDEVEFGRQRHEAVRHQDQHLKAEHIVDRFRDVTDLVMQFAQFGQLFVQSTFHHNHAVFG